MPTGPAAEPLPLDVAQRLTDFARACKGATRSVTLYPDGHPAIVGALARLVDAASRAMPHGPLVITVTPGILAIDGRSPARPDAAIGELATLLHDHLVGELRVVAAGDPAAWRTFLLLLARPVDELLVGGGISRMWMATGGQHVVVTEIDYAEVLRERTSGTDAAWDSIVKFCLEGQATDLDEETMKALVEIAGDQSRLSDLVRQIDQEAAEGGGGRAQAQALLRLLRLLAQSAVEKAPDRLEDILRNAATAAGQLSPEVMLELLAERHQQPGAAMDVVSEVVDRMSDATLSSFVASAVVSERGATARLAQAFQALVPDDERQDALLGLIQSELRQTPLGRESSFEELWQRASEMLLSYRDEKFVSAEYGRELSSARSQAIDVERTSDDPPERVAAWVASVSEVEVRRLDLSLLLDLLRIEQDPQRWRDVLDPAVSHVDDLVLLGDLESAVPLVKTIAAEASDEGRPDRRAMAVAAIDKLAGGPLVSSMVSHLRTVDDAAAEHAKQLCHCLGTGVIRPLAESLTSEDRGRAFRRLTDILVSFGSSGRDAVEQLKASANPNVRRTAVLLLREFGGNDALGELALLIEDLEPNVQREAIRAIVNIGTDEAFAVLEHALATGDDRSREAITGALVAIRDERAVPLFSHILENREYRRTLRPVYEAAIEALGGLGGTDAAAALRKALYDGEWFAPLRTAAIRGKVAAALAQTRVPDARAFLEEAATNGPRGVRAAARGQLARGIAAPRRQRDGESA